MMPKAALCGCLTDLPSDSLAGLLNHPEVDLLEWRLDLFLKRYTREEAVDAFSILSALKRHPVVATNRPKREGGEFEGPEAQRFEVLHKAVEAGAEWVDLEGWVEETTLQEFRGQNARLLLSHHDFSATPERATLQRLAEAMARKHPDVIKFATHARTPEDNLRVLELIPLGREHLGVEVLAFCIGPLGRWSRLICLLLGSPWTYVQLPELAPAAPGQWTATEMRRLLKELEPYSKDNT
jgi:3-dehydroquinate dehydratase type I